MGAYEMPPQVAALPRTKSGIPVTWAAAWSGELSVEARPEPLLASMFGAAPLAYFSPEHPGMGEPHIAQPHASRVRRCVLQGICQVCGRPIGAGPRWVCDIRLGQELFRLNGRMVPLLIDAWTCDGCIGYSLHACPNLQRRSQVDVLHVRDWLLVPSLERPRWVPADIPYGPIGFVKIAALDYTVHPRNEWSTP